MLLLAAESISKHFGPDPILDQVSFEVRAGDRIGLVGPNGAGKTTLLNILAGELDADGGRIQRASGLRMEYLRQHGERHPGRTVWSEAQDALSHLLQMASEAERLAERIAAATDAEERAAFEQRFDQLQELLTHHDAYQIDHRIERVLHGVGFTDDTFQQPIQELSGGQWNRLALAKLLLLAPDVMLLDEPSNHLDLEATAWLENYLVETRSTLIVVSHDRFFLDRVTNRTFELFHSTIVPYRGNFSAYWRQKSERLEVERRAYENQQAEIAKLEDFIRRNHYGQKHAQAEDRRKKLERIERVAPPREIEQPRMKFPRVSRAGDIVIRAEDLSKSFDQPLFQDLRFDVLRGERWGILGRNGVGKTTLIRCLIGAEPGSSGIAVLGTGVVVGYFDQLLENLSSDLPAVEAIRPPGREFNEQQRRDLLASFGLTGEMVFQPLRTLSGGERNRVMLAYLAACEANLLVLDEPTNHLDLWARDALEKALREFEGTVLFVSHDRYFLNRVADHLVYLEPARHYVVSGNYDTLQSVLSTSKRRTETELPESTLSDASRTERSARDVGKPRRKRRFPYRKVADLEADIFQHEAKLQELHEQLNDPEILRDGRRVRETQTTIGEVESQLATLYEHWEEASELN